MKSGLSSRKCIAPPTPETPNASFPLLQPPYSVRLKMKNKDVGVCSIRHLYKSLLMRGLFILLLLCCVYDAPISKAVLCVIKCVKPNHLLLPALLVYSCNCCDAYIMRPQDVHFFLCCHRIYAILNLLSLLLVWCSFKNS